jgi:hypothetical protein
MLPSARSHEEYQSFVLQQLRLHYSNGSLLFVTKDWPLVTKFWITDLSATFDMLRSTYSCHGPEATDPTDLLRSYLLMLEVGQPSITEWVNDLRRCPLYAILSGFKYGNTPGVGTFYDFFRRLWSHGSPSLAPQGRLSRKKPVRGKKGEKAPTTTPNRIAKLLSQLQRRTAIQSQPFDVLLRLFQQQFLSVSSARGLLGDVHALSIAGDGMPVQTAAQIRSKRICSCREQGIAQCSCHRKFSQPDCDIGWDSYRNKFFFGYHLYSFVAADSPYDLPVYPRLQRASRHDATSWVVSTREFTARFPEYTWDKVLLDAAHDAMAIYEYLQSRQVKPFIDLNQRNTGNKKYKDDIMISRNGVPICKKGLEMKDRGYDSTRARRKYHCPLVVKGVVTCDTPCSDSPYGRCVHTYTKDNPRLFPPVARHSDEWARVYKRRTTCERNNKRAKEDFHLEAAKHRSTMMWTIRIYGIAMCQHIDAWYQESNLDLKSMLLSA